MLAWSQGIKRVWGTLPEHLNSTHVPKEAVQQKVAFVPGALFHADGSGHNTVRIDFSNASPEVIQEGIRRLRIVLQKQIERQVLA